MNCAYSFHQAVLAYEPAAVNNAVAFWAMPNLASANAVGLFASRAGFGADDPNKQQSHAMEGSA